MHPARLGFRGMDPRVQPEDDSADKGALLTTEAVEPSVTGSEKRGKGGVMLAPARLGFRGMDPRVKPEDDSSDKGAILATEAVEASVNGSEKRGKRARCLDGACGEYGQTDEDSRP